MGIMSWIEWSIMINPFQRPGQVCKDTDTVGSFMHFLGHILESTYLHTLVSLQLLNCIMDMVEKTRRSLTVLRRCQEADREEMNHWIRRYSDVEEMKKGGSNGQHCLPPPLPPPPTPHNSSSNTASSSSSESLPVGTSSAAERQTGRQTGSQTRHRVCSAKPNKTLTAR